MMFFTNNYLNSFCHTSLFMILKVNQLEKHKYLKLLHLKNKNIIIRKLFYKILKINK